MWPACCESSASLHPNDTPTPHDRRRLINTGIKTAASVAQSRDKAGNAQNTALETNLIY